MQNMILILSSVLLNCCAQLFMRRGMMKNGVINGLHSLLASVPSMLTNAYLWAAMVCYVVSLLIWMVVLSKVEVSYAYPFVSIGYVLSAVLGYLWLQEQITPVRAAGMAVICVGVFLISRS